MTPLSIVIAGVPDRMACLTELLDEFRRQIGDRDDVELLVLLDDRRRTLGEKRDILNDMAKGRFIVHWDDDDWPSVAYIDRVLAAIQTHPEVDVINYPCILIQANDHQPIVKHYRVAEEAMQKRFSIKHPIRAELARSVQYGFVHYCSDMEYQAQLDEKIVTEAYIDRPLYFYMPNGLAVVDIFNRDIARMKDLDHSRRCG